MLQKAKDYKDLIKLNLSLLVVLGSIVGYVMVPNVHTTLLNIVLLFVSGMLVTGSANAFNEVMEVETDNLMKRTKVRPLPQARMEAKEALGFAVVSLFAGLAIMWINFNFLTALLSFISFAIYVFAYTPLKKVSPICVLVGALPGALPALIGWVAGANGFGMGAFTLFAIQFLWQFPHFWSIAWLGHDDYTKAGLKMLPTNTKENNFTAIQCLFYTIALLSFSILPKLTGIAGWLSVAIIAVAGLWFLLQAYNFYKNNSNEKARKLMFASFIYLPVVYIALIIDKV